LIFVIAWENIIFLPGLGTASKIAGLIIAGVWGLTVLLSGRLRKLHAFHLLVFLYFAWHFVSSFWSIDREVTLERAMTYVQLVIMIWLFWDLYTTPATLRAGLQAYVLGAYVSLGTVIQNYLIRGSAINSELIYQRFTADGFNANDLALILALGIPLAWYLAVSNQEHNRARGLKIVNYMYIPMATFAILLTASRSGLLVVFASLPFILGTFSTLRPVHRFLIFVALVGALYGAVSLAPDSTLARLGTIDDSIREWDFNNRINIWSHGLDVFLENPLVGTGSNTFAVKSHTVAHNVYLSILVEVGIIGFILFTLILLSVIKQARRQPALMSKLWLAVLLVWAVGVMSLSWEHRKQTWLFLSFVVISANVSLQENKSLLKAQVCFFSVKPSNSVVLQSDRKHTL
jgi:O-antigen ligase